MFYRTAPSSDLPPGAQEGGTPVNGSQRQDQPPQSPFSNLAPRMGADGLNLLWSATTEPLAGSGGANVLPSPRLRKSTPNVSSPGDSETSGPGPDGFFGDSSTFAFVSKVQSDSPESNGVHLQTEQLPVTHNSPSTTTDTSKAIFYQLPERRLADTLVDGYFDRVHPLYPFLHEGSFRAEYENMWNCRTPLPPSWYALLNIVCALGCEFCDAIPEGSLTMTVTPFVDRSREIILSHIYRKGNLEFVQALLLMCHYLQGTLELNECWNLVGLMIRTAVSIGLQLNPENLPLTTVEKEVRKRVWWGCFIIDRTLSMKFGRPPALQEADAQDVPFPLSVDDQYIQNESSTPRQPAGRAAAIAFFLHTIKLSKVIDHILQHLYATNRRNVPDADPARSEQSRILSSVVLLDGQLQSWWDDVPAHLRPDSAATEGQIFQRQRAVMQIR
jgi:hypothetical protein